MTAHKLECISNWIFHQYRDIDGTVEEDGQDINLTYGEILYWSLPGVIQHMGLTADHHLLELGSGKGRAAWGFWWLSGARVTGVEINPKAHAMARLSAKGQVDGPRWILGDACQLSWRGYDALFMVSTCFTADLLGRIVRKINASADLEVLASLKPLKGLSSVWQYQGQLRVQCSWSSSMCYIYKRSKTA